MLSMFIELASFLVLAALNAKKIHLKHISPEIGLLKSLLHINLQYNKLNEIPVEIGALESLRRLDLSHNRLIKLPHEFCLLKTLDWLDISFNYITEFPAAFGSLRSLKVVDASRNKIDEIAISVGALRQLKKIDLSANKISEFQAELCSGLQSLVCLNLSLNRIKRLPIEIIQMKSLQNLDLESNKLEAIPIEFAPYFSNKQVKLNLKNNPFGGLPFKWNSKWDLRQKYENLNGYTTSDVKEWLIRQSIFYHMAVNVWNDTSEFHLSNQMVFDDFMKDIERKLNFYIENRRNNKYQILSKSNHGLKSLLKKFYFECKKCGYPPAYTSISHEDVISRAVKSTELSQNRMQRMLIARNVDLECRTLKNQIYVGNFTARIKDAVTLFENREKKIQLKRKREVERLLSTIKNKIPEQEDKATAVKKEQSRKSQKETDDLKVQVLAELELASRELPLKLIPCWK